MTLRELYYESAKRVDEDININADGSMDNNTTEIVSKFLTSINYMYRKVSKEKRLFLKKEIAALENGILDISLLGEEFCELLKLETLSGERVKYLEVSNTTIECDTNEDNIVIYYYFFPEKLEELTDSTQFPNDVDENILCFFAAYDYLNIEGENEDRVKAQSQLILLNDALDGIKKRKGPVKYVKEV